MFGTTAQCTDTTQTCTVRNPSGSMMSFTFLYKFVDLCWRAYIISGPSYGNRSDDLLITHRYIDRARNMYYVCWTTGLLRLEDMIEVSRLWARETAKYIETGEQF